MNKAQVMRILEDRQSRKPKVIFVTRAYSILSEHEKAIRDAAERAGMSQSEVVRAALDQFFDVQQEVIGTQ
jgi:ribosome-binding protein aMBF1 (putative translation factor)